MKLLRIGNLGSEIVAALDGNNVIRDLSDHVKALNLNTLQILLDNKKINIDEKINLNILKKNNIISKKVSKFKILGNGEISKKLNLEVDYISKSAKEKLEKNGSTIIVKSLKE